MNKFLITFLITLSIFSSASEDLDRIIVSKTLITLDATNKNSNAVMIRGAKIHAVGQKESLINKFPDAIIDYSFANDVIIPGFIEHHIHPLLAAITMSSEIVAIDDWSLPNKKTNGVRDRAGYMKRLQVLEKNIEDKNTPLISWGFHHYFHGKLTKDDLDKLNDSINNCKKIFNL